MIDVVAPALGGLLLITGLTKVRHPALFRRALRTYELLPAGLVAPVARAVSAAELGIGIACLSPPLRRPALLAAAALLACLSLGAATALVRGASAHCGCMTRGTDDQRLTWAIPARNLAIAALGAGAAGTTASGEPLAAGLAGGAALLVYLTADAAIPVIRGIRDHPREGRRPRHFDAGAARTIADET